MKERRKKDFFEVLDTVLNVCRLAVVVAIAAFIFSQCVFAEEVPPDPVSMYWDEYLFPYREDVDVEEYEDVERDYLIVVNRDNPYDFEGEYANELLSGVIITDEFFESDEFDEDDYENLSFVMTHDVVDNDPILVEYGTWCAFLELKEELESQGMYVGLYDGYRTWEQQKNVYDYFGSLDGWADKNTVLLPYFSEHHTGLLLNVVVWYDIDGDGKSEWCTETAERQEQFPYFKLLHENLADFGFIDRYPAGKEKLTGVVCEPYEIRYVGSSEMAHRIVDDGFCLEEVVGEVPISQPWSEEMAARIAEFALSSKWYSYEIKDLVDQWIMQTSGL